MAKNTETFVVKKGHEHYGHDADGNRKLFVAGDKVELSANQAAAFKDKFDSLKELKARARVAEEMDKDSEAQKAASVETQKKPDPTPSVGTAEPTVESVTPPPVGSTPTPTGTQQQENAQKTATAQKK